MNELDILRVVRSERRPSWGGTTRYSYQQFRQDLSIAGVFGADLSDSVISSVLNGRSGVDDRKILGLLAGHADRARAARTAIEASLGLPGLFQCQNRAEVVALLARVDGDRGQDPRVVVLTDDPPGDFGITRPESEAVKHLSEMLIHENQPIHHWDAPFNSGSSTVVQGLWGTFAEHKPYSAMWIIRPSDFKLPYEIELGRLRRFLDGRGHGVDTRRALARAIAAERILLVLLSPCALDAAVEPNAALDLLKEFQSQHSRWSGAANVLVVGQSDTISKLRIPNSESLSGMLKRRLSFKGEAAFVEFQAQWKRFAGLRDELASELSGARMRRAATYFRVQNKGSIWPVSVKLRALFASNVRGAAYFDPTQGFKRLAGQVYGMFGDIADYVEDVSDYIGYVRHLDTTAGGGSRGKRRYFYLLQYVSTGLYWLTEEALECLIDKIPPDRLTALNLETEKRRMGALAPIVTEKRESANETASSRYFASIGVKAVVQDDWIKSEPYLRSLAHYRIARRLKTNENDKQLLGREFPYEPYWGRSRIFFVGEAIRHLVRSCETYGGEVSCVGEEYGKDFPAPPAPADRGTDPAQVINYCYSVLYQDLLNGNANGKASRSLAKRYGAYRLSVEVLSLVSENFEVGVPHRALKPELRLEFMRECGFSLLDVGELSRSRQTFERAKAEAATTGSPLDNLSILLDLALVGCVEGDLAAAETALAEARHRLTAVHAEGSNLDSRSYLRIRKAFRRLLAREAHLAFLRGDHERTLDILDQLESEARWSDSRDGQNFNRKTLVPSFAQRVEAEQVHLKVAALHRRAEVDRRAGISNEDANALNICFREMLHAGSNGLHHQAMGFRIEIARCFRRANRLDTAEVILDAVHLDLLRYGCSERTFLSFLNEAGRVLGSRGDPIRAYATYLKPCLVRARTRGFLREAQQAAVQAMRMLEAISVARDDAEQARAGASQSWEARLEAAIAGHRQLVADTEHIFSGDILERDPLYAYAIADAENVIWSLRVPAVIEAEHQKIRAFITERDAAKG